MSDSISVSGPGLYPPPPVPGMDPTIPVAAYDPDAVVVNLPAPAALPDPDAAHAAVKASADRVCDTVRAVLFGKQAVDVALAEFSRSITAALALVK